MAKLTEADRALLAQATQQAKARVALQQIQQTGNSQREAARTRMTGRTIDETGRDINERKPEPEPIKTGWYWTGEYTVWVVGPTNHGTWVHCLTTAGDRWVAVRRTINWQRVHEQVQESGQGFGWRMPAPNH